MSDALAALAGLPGFLPAGFAAALVALAAFASLAGFSACLEFVGLGFVGLGFAGLGFAGLDLDAAWLEGVGLALALVALTGAEVGGGAAPEGAEAGDLAPALSLAMAD